MGKTAAYIATAVLLAVVAMLPVISFNPERTEVPGRVFQHWSDEEPRLIVKEDVEFLQSQKDFGMPSIPSSPLHIAAILALSFVFAFGAFFYSKRKMF